MKLYKCDNCGDLDNISLLTFSAQLGNPYYSVIGKVNVGIDYFEGTDFALCKKCLAGFLRLWLERVGME